MYKLRPYQQEAVQAAVAHFRGQGTPAVIVLPTGAGKSLVIAELARLAQGRVLVLAHVRELVEQNYEKLVSLGQEAGVFSAGLDRKEANQKTIFGSIQSVARAPAEFFRDFSLLIIDECHRVSMEGETQYQQVITRLQDENPKLRVLGLTATPYRLGFGWIYEYHAPLKIQRSSEPRFFKRCVYEVTIRSMIRLGYLTRPVLIDAPVSSYDFSSLRLHGASFFQAEIDKLLRDQKRVTRGIIENIVEMSRDRQGVMIFTSSVAHAEEIMRYLPPRVSALVVGDTESRDREDAINAFKKRELKFLVNVSVLTTGFDAPHVDVIALLRPTESAGLFQQIVGRGLRLAPGKEDCLILDYTGQGHDLYAPDIGDDKPVSDAVIVDVVCPQCGVINQFWGLVDGEGALLEHFGRKCRAATEDPATGEIAECGYLFRFKRCDHCGAENDIAARECVKCAAILVDPDRKLRDAMSLKDAHVMRVDTMELRRGRDKKGSERLEVHYFDADANELKEYFYLDSREKRQAFYLTFARVHLRIPELKLDAHTVDDVLGAREKFRAPLYIIARKKERYWVVREKVF